MHSPQPTLWIPARVLLTRSATGVREIRVLTGDRLPRLRAEIERAPYALAKKTLAVVVAPLGKLRLQPIPPSADWRIDLAEGCPGLCQYCYLAGSTTGPPITRVYGA